jgi:hypothetical protein
MVYFLGRFDIQTAIMSLSRYRVAPRVGHLDRIKHVCGYLRQFKDAAIRVRTSKPDLSQHNMVEKDWLYSVYGNIKKKFHTILLNRRTVGIIYPLW